MVTKRLGNEGVRALRQQKNDICTPNKTQDVVSHWPHMMHGE